MNPKRKKKLIGIICILLLLSGAISLALYALKQNINLFYMPTQLLQAHVLPNQTIRIGGYVKKGSLHYDSTGNGVTFLITDNKNDIPVEYHGILPNLFREGQGVVTTGKLSAKNKFFAQELLAKHDEKYMPWPLAQSLKGSKS